ncbi:hypothetical protein [Streptomyces sp. NPDC029003]|uniref:hypothetical protein n=1 Tax=Streptomyces sp. NPDC029003 TaxID=3155125 RepID=UPI00340DD8E2
MKLTKQIASISVAAAATVLLSAGGAQAQGDGEFLSFLGNAPLQKISYPVQLGDGNTYTGTQNTNNNTNNNSGKGIANNNNNNNNGGGSQADGTSSTLGRAALQEISYPVQVGGGNTYIGTQNINNNINNNTGSGTYNNNNNNNNGGGTFNNNNNNNNGGVNNNNNNNNNGGGASTNNNNNNNNGRRAHRDIRTLSGGKLAPLLNEAAYTKRQVCSSSMGYIVQNSTVISGALQIHCTQN